MSCRALTSLCVQVSLSETFMHLVQAMYIAYAYSNPVVTGGQKHTHVAYDWPFVRCMLNHTTTNSPTDRYTHYTQPCRAPPPSILLLEHHRGYSDTTTNYYGRGWSSNSGERRQPWRWRQQQPHNVLSGGVSGALPIAKGGTWVWVSRAREAGKRELECQSLFVDNDNVEGGWQRGGG